MDYLIGLNERSQHPRTFKGDRYKTEQDIEYRHVMDDMKIRAHGAEYAIFYRFFDLCVITFSLALASYLILGRLFDNWLLISVVNSVCFLFIAENAFLYRSWRISNFQGQVMATLLSWAGSFLLLISFFFFSNDEVNRQALLLWCGIGGFFLVFWRYLSRKALRYLRHLGFNTRGAAIIGITPNGIELARELKNNPALGIEVHGFYEDRETSRIEENLPAPLLGRVSEALEKAKSGKLQHIYIAMPMHAKERIEIYLNQFSDTTATIYVVPDFLTYNLLHSRWQTIGQVHTLSVYDTPFSGITAFVKRVEDIVLSLLILLFISPVMLLVSIGVKASSKGPVLFKQDRYGLDGCKIEVWKFRSMSTMDNGCEIKQATKNDPRVTSFGAFIRRTSLDELPQFFNVLQGSMSIVGPRPHAVAHNELYRAIVDRYMLRHKVKPGITGLAQIKGYRGETDTLEKMQKRVQFDLEYIQNWSFWMDIKIVITTIFKGFVGNKAY